MSRRVNFLFTGSSLLQGKPAPNCKPDPVHYKLELGPNLLSPISDYKRSRDRTPHINIDASGQPHDVIPYSWGSTVSGWAG
jgi:hypothetical protein